MDNKQDLQFTPVGSVKPRTAPRRGSEVNTRNFKQTEINNHGKKKGTVKWNRKKIIGLVLAGAMIVVAKEGIDNYQANQQASQVDNTIAIEQEGVMPSQAVDEEAEATYTVDYQVKSGDTLDGIIYRYADSANEMSDIKRDVMFYNNIEQESAIRQGQIITLFKVPESMVDEMNTGYNEDFVFNDEASELLSTEIQALNDEYPSVVIGSELNTLNKEWSVYSSTTNEQTRSYLAQLMVRQISDIQTYGNDVGVKSR